MSRFEGKVALVTGGGSGIGRATALKFFLSGYECQCQGGLVFDEM